MQHSWLHYCRSSFLSRKKFSKHCQRTERERKDKLKFSYNGVDVDSVTGGRGMRRQQQRVGLAVFCPVRNILGLKMSVSFVFEYDRPTLQTILQRVIGCIEFFSAMTRKCFFMALCFTSSLMHIMGIKEETKLSFASFRDSCDPHFQRGFDFKVFFQIKPSKFPSKFPL